jgi:hypothetical protein
MLTMDMRGPARAVVVVHIATLLHTLGTVGVDSLFCISIISCYSIEYVPVLISSFLND